LRTHETGDISQSVFINKKDKDIIDDALIGVVVRDLEPFQKVISTSKKKLYSKLNPLYKVPAVDTIKNTIKEKYEEAVENEKNELKSATSIYIDFDGWSNNGIYVLGLNIHYLDNNFELQKKHLGTATFDEIHKVSDVKAKKNKRIM